MAPTQNAQTTALTTIVVVEDEYRSQCLLRGNLELLGYQVVTLDTASSGAEVVEQYNPQIIVLDVMLPGSDGMDLCRQVRSVSHVPIIMVTGVNETQDKVHALKLGADDYITKPYDPAELAARIGAVLRRVQGMTTTASPVFRTADLEIDFEQHLVRVSGREISLTSTEYRLLEYLAQNAGRTIVADAIVSRVWDTDYFSELSSVHLYISRLRRKLGDNARQSRYIITKPGVGYQMIGADDRSMRSYN